MYRYFIYNFRHVRTFHQPGLLHFKCLWRATVTGMQRKKKILEFLYKKLFTLQWKICCFFFQGKMLLFSYKSISNPLGSRLGEFPRESV